MKAAMDKLFGKSVLKVLKTTFPYDPSNVPHCGK
jgi:hypothetical protein